MHKFSKRERQGELKKYSLTDVYENKTQNSFPIKKENVTNIVHQKTQEPIKSQGERWAVIVGVSKYKDTRIPSFRYASADAQAFYNWIVSSNGGNYAPSRVKLLIDQEATGSNIKNALFTWLTQAIAEDIVTIYFAGHGSPNNPESPDNLFLYPYDTQ
jgi:hypothetical protein